MVMSCFHWFKQLPHMILVRQMKGSVVSYLGSSATRDGGTPETWSAADLRNLQIIATNVLPAQACCGSRNKSRRDQAGSEQRAQSYCHNNSDW
jgi:hypothetical protein